MKKFVRAAVSVVFAAFVLVGCGGRPTFTPLRAADVFTNRAETWVLQNQYGDTTTIEVIPVDSNHCTWHYTKSADRAYWAVGAPQAELWFDLERDSTGAWYSTGGVVSFPQGCPWCHAPYVNERYPVFTTTGQARPYLILPAKAGFSYQTLFDDMTYLGPGDLYTGYNTTWKTAGYMERVDTPVYSGAAFISDQWEGPCTHEKWYFAPGLGLVKILPLDAGDCQGDDPKLAMVRIK